MRIIATLLLNDRLAFVSDKFMELHYVGDPLTTARIISKSRIDELLVVDLTASRDEFLNSGQIKALRSICDYPLSYAGGVRSKDDIDKLFRLGIDRVYFNALSSNLRELTRHSAEIGGKQAVGISLSIGKIEGCWKAYDTHRRRYTNAYMQELMLRIESLDFADLLITNVETTGSKSSDWINEVWPLARGLRKQVVMSGGLTIDALDEYIRLGIGSIAISRDIFCYASFESPLVSIGRLAAI